MESGRISRRPRPRCLNCDDDGVVESIADGERPCSRCRPEAFNAWYAERFRVHEEVAADG